MRAPKYDIGSVCKHPCPECGGRLTLRKSKHGRFYGCTRFPGCNGAHGAHPDGRPLGIPANKETKEARMAAHAVFDRIWREGPMSRTEAYAWMSRRLNLTKGKAHIGRFTMAQCDALIQAITEDWANLVTGERHKA